ncbi:DUF4198 domain-containing protein [Motiliproteus sp. MSK22-1]|uniref:DUF4198 domain-containing protein n=1 Tax=Motiliproteus sp. MSK22-1 TaxID=1897630 RepID=UPI000976F41B|nr:DUF4198 domain-containing protein [Motiliproteus sp. MSK22-1]OMH34002.1 nickel transporter [Motiliproteus sp. MSK22-1]
MLKKLVATLVVSASAVSAAHAHFQMLYTPDLLREKGGEISLKAPFTHPASSGHVMTVDKPQQFFQIRKGKKKDLIDQLVAGDWTSAENKGPSYEASVKLRGLGDNVFVLQAAPYYEEAENKYIQQITKTIVNVGGLPTDWEAEVGLPAEIVPLTKPYAIYEHGSFSGIVKSEGKPVPYAEIEVEYINYLPDMKANAFAKESTVTLPADAFTTITIYADATGTFTFGIPKAGQWGFGALNVGPEKEYKGKELSQDAVIWVQAHAINKPSL